MADWATVGIALIAAAGSLGGVWLKSLFDERRLEREKSVQEANLLREKLHALMLEIDRIEHHFTSANLDILRYAAFDVKDIEKRDPVSFATIRALISLHFPECAPHLAEFDAKDKKVYDFIIQEMKKKSDLKTVGAIAGSKRSEIYSKFAANVRQELSKTAGSIGVSATDLSARTRAA